MKREFGGAFDVQLGMEYHYSTQEINGMYEMFNVICGVKDGVSVCSFEGCDARRGTQRKEIRLSIQVNVIIHI
jgi:hypothetical protein